MTTITSKIEDKFYTLLSETLDGIDAYIALLTSKKRNILHRLFKN